MRTHRESTIDAAARAGCPAGHAPADADSGDRPGGRGGAQSHDQSASHQPSPEQTGRLSRVPGSQRLTWLLGQGLARHGIRHAAGKGDLISRMEIDPGLRANPYPGYDELRRQGPMVRGSIVWATTQHASANQVLRSDDFGVAGGHGELPPWMRRVLHATTDPMVLGPVDPPSLLAVDPPTHTRYRRLVSRIFTPRAVSRMEPRIREVAEDLLDSIEARGLDAFDLIEEYAAQLPLSVIADVLGVPAEMHQPLLGWGNGAARMLDPGLSWRDYRTATRDMAQMHRWFDSHVTNLRRDPGDDLFSKLASLDGEDRLTDLELAATGLLVLGAGFETTVNLIGNAVTLLDRAPESLDTLLAEPDLWGNAVEETLRFESPVQLTMRQAYADTSVGGVDIPSGQAVLVMLAGANRDPDVFADPHRFDVRRENASDHIAFSAGVHFCLGPSLARMEAKVALEALYARFPRLSVNRGPGAAGPRLRPNRVLRGYEHLPVTVSARA